MGLETAGAVGAWVTGGFFAAGSVGAAVVGGAIIGAAIGGLVAAVSGGSIGKGMLFGAIGGAVMSGIGAGMAGGGFTTAPTAAGGSAQTSTGVLAGSPGQGQYLGISKLPETATNTATTWSQKFGTVAANTTKATALEEMGTQLAVNTATEGIKGYVQSQAANEQMEALQKEKELQREHEKELLQMKIDAEGAAGGGGGGGGGSDTLAYNARMAELNQRKDEFNRTMGMEEEKWGETKKAAAARKALFAGGGARGSDATEEATATTGIYDQLQEKPKAALIVPEEEAVLS